MLQSVASPQALAPSPVSAPYVGVVYHYAHLRRLRPVQDDLSFLEERDESQADSTPSFMVNRYLF
jgi:hypothetical protein